MNIKQLRELIKDLPDDLQILTDDRDHHYRHATVEVADVEYIEKFRCYCEYFDKLNMHPEGKKTKALVVN